MGKKKNGGGEAKNKGEGGKKEEGPTRVVLKIHMHCERCNKRIIKYVCGLDGVEEIKANCETNRIIVDGKVDPAELREKLKKKMKKTVELISLSPKKDGGGGGGDKKEKNNPEKKPDEKNAMESHYEENAGPAPAERFDQVANDTVEHHREEVATEVSIRVEERSLLLVAPDNPVDVLSRPEIHDRNPKVFGKRLFVIGNFFFEILGLALSQASSPNKPEFALAGLVMSFVVMMVCIIEFGWRAQRAKVTMGRWGWIWWFYHPPPDVRLFGTFVDILDLTCAISQLISSAIDFGFFHRHADNPVKVSLFPVFFAAFIAGLEFIKNPIELSHRATRSVVDHGEEELEIIVAR